MAAEKILLVSHEGDLFYAVGSADNRHMSKDSSMIIVSAWLVDHSAARGGATRIMA
jgi:hypothetical protein